MHDFYGKRKIFYILSVIIILSGVISYFVSGGFTLDVQFEGGTVLQLEMADNNYNANNAADLVKSTINKDASAQKLSTYNPDDPNTSIYLMKIQIAKSEGALTSDEQTKLIDAFRNNPEFNVSPDAEMQVQSIEPAIGKEVMNNSILAIIVAFIAIIIYIWIRFKVMSGLPAGITAVIALMHDVAVMFTVGIILRIPINESFIAAVLTIIGYSVNDTVIIYDRIRENTPLMRKASLPDIVNKSITQSLTRSLNTMMAVLISITTVYIFAWRYNIETITDFSLPLVVGMISGCYSTIFIASQLWAMWKIRKTTRVVAPKTSKA